MSLQPFSCTRGDLRRILRAGLMRAVTLPAALVIAFVVPAAAQSRDRQSHQPAHRTDEASRPSIGLPLPQIGLTLPPIGLPLRSMGVPQRRTERSERIERPERPGRPEHRRGGGSRFLYWPAFDWPYPSIPETPEPSPLTPSPTPPQGATGWLVLELQSGVDPQIYVNGYYVGLLSDTNGGELTLNAGPHVVELRAEGYEALHVDIQIAADRVVRYHGEMKALRSSVEPPRRRTPEPSPRTPTIIYLIPGCYVGNVTPREIALPAGCNPDRAVPFPLH